MAENMGMPPLEEPKKKNNTVIIIVSVLAVLCCCCVIGLGIAYQFGDQVMSALGVY